MGVTLNKESYSELVKEDIQWLKDNAESSLESGHIIQILECSIETYYKDGDFETFKKQVAELQDKVDGYRKAVDTTQVDNQTLKMQLSNQSAIKNQRDSANSDVKRLQAENEWWRLIVKESAEAFRMIDDTLSGEDVSGIKPVFMGCVADVPLVEFVSTKIDDMERALAEGKGE